MKDIFVRALSLPDVELYIMNSSPQALQKDYSISTPEELVTGKSPSLLNMIKRLRRIVSADLYIYGGGTIITDKHSYFHLIENALYFTCRKIFNKKSLLISVGSTKFKTKKGRFFGKRLIKASTYAYIRDEDSYAYLKKITNNSKKLIQSADMVLLSKHIIHTKDYEKPGNTIGLCFMPYYYATYHQGTKDDQLLDCLVEQVEAIGTHLPEFRFVLIPIQAGQNDATDYLFSEKIYKRLKNKVNLTINKCDSNEEKIAELSRCRYVISMRLHALMLTKLMGNSVFAINHNEKIEYFMKRYDNIHNCVSLDNVNTLATSFMKSIETNDQESMQESANRLAADAYLAQNNITIIRTCLGMEA